MESILDEMEMNIAMVREIACGSSAKKTCCLKLLESLKPNAETDKEYAALLNSKVQLLFENEELKNDVEQLQSAVDNLDQELGFCDSFGPRSSVCKFLSCVLIEPQVTL